MSSRLMGIDPGRNKWGIAFLCDEAGERTTDFMTLHTRGEDWKLLLASIIERYAPDTIVVGNGTCSAEALEILEKAAQGAEVVLTDERGSTMEARRRMKRELRESNPWIRLLDMISCGLFSEFLLDEERVDAWAALVILERWNESGRRR